MSSSTNNNIEHLAIEFVADCMLIHVRRWEQGLGAKLLTREERSRFFVEMNLEGLLRGDQASRYAAYAVGRQWGWLSPNDIRARENLPELPTDVGNRYLVPQNMAPADRMDEVIDAQARAKTPSNEPAARELPAPAETRLLTAGPSPEIVAAFSELLADGLRRIIRREAAELRRLLPVWRSKRRTPAEIAAEVSAVHEQMREAAGQILGPLERAFPSIAPIAFASGCALRNFESSAEQVAEILRGPGETLAALEARLSEWERSRAEVTARLETEALAAGRVTE
jgi:hypothetical protein